METITLDHDIKILCVTASSFPEGISAAYEKLRALLKDLPERDYYGLSRPENGKIVYHAAAKEIAPGEAEKLGCKTLLVKKGKYVSLMVNDYKKNVPAISQSFDVLLRQPGLDPQGYCVEWYFTPEDVRCMVRLKD